VGIIFFGETFLNFEGARDISAAFCRRYISISKWHEMEKGRALNELEVDFIVALIMGWIERQTDKEVD
jgi:hypothetical protein